MLSRTVRFTPHQVEEGVPCDLTSEISRLTDSWPIRPMQGRLQEELSKAIKATVQDTLQEYQSTASCNREVNRTNPKVLNGGRRNRGTVYRVTVTRTPLGELRCVHSRSFTDADGGEERDPTDSDDALEFKIKFSFFPSWLMSKLGVSAVSLHVVKSGLEGLKTVIRTFNVCCLGKDSILQSFEY